MDIKQLNEEIEKVLKNIENTESNNTLIENALELYTVSNLSTKKLNKIDLAEHAWKQECGTELKTVKIGERIIKNPSLTQKIKELIKITDGERGMIVNQKVSDAFDFNFEGEDYEMLINIGQSLKSDIDIKANFGTSHMQEEHWASSKMALDKFEDATEHGFLMPSYDKNLNEEFNKVWLIYDDKKKLSDDDYGKYIYVIGLSNGDKESVTILITCFDYTTSYEGYVTSMHVLKGIEKAKAENRVYPL